DLDSEGNCLGVRSIDKKEARGFLCESVTKTRNVVARVLVDNSEYLLGITADETKNAKNVTPQDKFNAFLDKNTPYLRETAHLKPVYNFYFDKKTTGLEKAK
ncbi:type I-C CRISPR-associated protein Cas8c/Csd1, partial [Arthrospira platensis SPKY1]|nr:type I-C CRISPR-associated protein Cas8c/Csd1 [Arthrospira platensis SPKY1]